MKKKWTNQKLFKQIVEDLRAHGELPGILEYDMPAFEEEVVDSYELDCLGTLFFGNEGIIVQVRLEGRAREIPLGRFKTLRDDKESWDIMAQLMADFQWECTAFIEDHIEEFEGEYDDL